MKYTQWSTLSVLHEYAVEYTIEYTVKYTIEYCWCMRSEVSGGPGIQSGIQSCMSRSLPNIHLDGPPAVSFAFSLLSDVCNYTRIMMNIIVLHQQVHGRVHD